MKHFDEKEHRRAQNHNLAGIIISGTLMIICFWLAVVAVFMGGR